MTELQPTPLKPYTEHAATCSHYNDDAKRQFTPLVYSSIKAEAPISEPSSPAAQVNIDERVRHAITIMVQYLHRDLNINEIASHVNLSTWHFCHLFKKGTEVAPAQYLKGLRLMKARELLEDTFLSFKEIKCRVGIKDESHFARSFKQRFGAAPALYRTRFRQTRAIEAARLSGIRETARN